MGFWDSGNLFGNAGAAGSVLGGLGTAATIYGLYQQNQQQQSAADSARNFQQSQTDEAKREFDLKYALEQQKLAAKGGGGGGGGGGGNALAMAQLNAQIQHAHSQAIQGAHDSLITAVENGRNSEASSLMGLLDRVQKAYGAA